jgi:hypothetical protein
VAGASAARARLVAVSVLLQLTVALQFHFLAFAGSYSRPFQRDLLSTKNHITRLLSPAHTPGRRMRPMRGSYPARYFVFQDSSQSTCACSSAHTSAIGNGTCMPLPFCTPCIVTWSVISKLPVICGLTRYPEITRLSP